MWRPDASRATRLQVRTEMEDVTNAFLLECSQTELLDLLLLLSWKHFFIPVQNSGSNDLSNSNFADTDLIFGPC